MFTHFTGNSKNRQINLGSRSTSNAAGPSNSQDLLVKARAERQAREKARLQASSVALIQKIWRGRRVAQQIKGELLRTIEAGSESVEWTGRALMVILWNSNTSNLDERVEIALASWCRSVVGPESGKSRH